MTYKIEESNFNFLGIQIRSNPRRIGVWKQLVEKIKSRLSTWKDNFLSQRGRLTLINSVLNSLPIFFLSFFKAHVSVWKEIERVHRDFFWGSLKNVRKISLVSWNQICKDKSK